MYSCLFVVVPHLQTFQYWRPVLVGLPVALMTKEESKRFARWPSSWYQTTSYRDYILRSSGTDSSILVRLLPPRYRSSAIPYCHRQWSAHGKFELHQVSLGEKVLDSSFRDRLKSFFLGMRLSDGIGKRIKRVERIQGVEELGDESLKKGFASLMIG